MTPDSAYRLWISLLLGMPFFAFFFLWLAGKNINRIAGWTGFAVTLAGFAVSFFTITKGAPVLASFHWISIGDFSLDLAFRFDGLTSLMLLLVHFVALLVQVYSVTYMHDDANLHRYFAFLQLFLFSMIGIVLAESLLVMYIFWELVGLSSYLLIGFWYFKQRPVWAAQKAFVLNRIGDAAFLTGILMLLYYTGSTGLEVIKPQTGGIPPGILTVIGICLFGGCVGKSAQFPLSGWLPDAMEGPTPVSALIHAATMVAAGIFLLARISFLLTPDARLFITIIGTITMLTGAFKALNAWDIKKVLAYSTMSQLGLMVVAVGFGSWQTAMFHLLTHAFFKAGLFLSAGSVIHAMHPHGGHFEFDPQDMRTMGGLRKALPITFICFSICAAALAGLPLFSGFLSKDAIITEGFANAGQWGAIGYIFPVIALFSAGLTAYYMTRQLWLVFFGEARYPDSAVHPHESPATMWLPMAILAALSFFWWFSFNPFDAAGWFFDWVEAHPSGHIGWVPFVAIATSLLFIFLAYQKAQQNDPFGAMQSFNTKDKNEKAKLSWLRDYSPDQYFIIPFAWITRYAKALDTRIVDRLIDWLAKGSVIGAHVVSWVDKHIVDGGVSLTVFTIRSAGRGVRSMQSGRIQSYYIVTAVGVFFLILWLMVA